MKIYCPKCKKPFPATPPPEGGKEIACPGCGEKIACPETPTSPGAVVGDFLIEREISRGGMGEVYLARQLSLDRPVALKVLQDRFVHDKEYVDSLTREARAAAKINHPNIVQAYAVGEEDGIFYFAMEFIRGETLKQILKREKKLDFLRAAKIIQEIAGALDVAWREQKLVHQDIKPDNIMLDANGFAKLADLGLARTAGAGDADAEVGDEVMGTPQYISPEQLTGVPTDVRSDIYSLGATFYQFVTGRFPYVAPTADEIAKMHVAGKLTPPKEINPELPDELNAIIMKMMARDINARYQTPGPLIKALELFQQNHRSATGAIPTLNLKGGRGNAAPVLQLPKKKNAAPKPAAAPQQPSMPVRTMPSMPVKPMTRPGGAAAMMQKPAAAKPATPPSAAPQPSMPLKHMPSMPVKPMGRPAAAKPVPAADANATATAPEKTESTPPATAPEAKAPVVPKVAPPAVKPLGSIPKVAKPAVKMAESAAKVTEPAAKSAEPAAKVTEPTVKVAEPELKVVSKAAEEEDEVVGLKGEAANEEAPEETKGKKPRKEKKPKKPREPMSPRAKKILKTAVGIVILLLILVGLTGGLYIFAKKGQLPEAAKPHGEKFVAAVDDLLSRIKPLFASSKEDETEQSGTTGEVAQQPQQPQQSQQPQTPAKPEPPPPPPPPETRPEYLAAVDAALQIIRNNPEMRNEFLTAGDQFFERFPRPVTQEERAALQPLLDVYGRMDEVQRAAPAREEARKRHEAALAERRQRLQAEKEAEAARREAAEQERARAAEEQRKLNEQLQAQRAAEQREIDARTAEVRKAVEAYYPALYRGFFRQVFSGESDVLDAAVAAAGTYQLDFANNSPGEKALAEQLKSTTATIRSEAERLRNALVTLESVTDQKNGFNIELPHNELVRVVCAVPGKVSYRNDDGELVLLPMTNPAVYRTYMSRVASRLKLNLTDFEYALFSGEYPTAAKLLPDGFWKQHWAPMMTEYFRETLKTATPEQRQALEKRYGEMPEFKAAVQP